MTTDMKPIANCPRQKILVSDGVEIIYCYPPDNCADKFNKHCYQPQLISIDTCLNCSNQSTFLLSTDSKIIKKEEAIKKKKPPKLHKQIKHYAKAVINWANSGLKTRSDEEIARLFKIYCKKCDWYDPVNKRCLGCGCKVKPKGKAIFNKLKMATEHCPKRKF